MTYFYVGKGYSSGQRRFCRTQVARWLSNPFYYGKWVVNPGTKTERVIDLTSIRLPDGTTFTPVITEAEFWACQRAQVTNRSNTNRRAKHINPLPRLVLCHHCGAPLSPVTRNIKRAGGKTEPQLGFECCTIHPDGKRCPQCRIKADILFDAIADTVAKACLGQKQYHQFLIGVDSWLQKHTKDAHQERQRLTAKDAALKDQKVKVLRRKAKLIEADEYGPADRALIESELAIVDKDHTAVASQLSQIKGDISERVMRFRKFIEGSVKDFSHICFSRDVGSLGLIRE